MEFPKWWPFCKTKVEREVHLVLVHNINFSETSEPLAKYIDEYGNAYNQYLADEISIDTLEGKCKFIIDNAKKELDEKDFSLLKKWADELYQIKDEVNEKA